jgi:hypothetical protein
MTTHRNSDRSNAYCHCRIGTDHGNMPQAERETVLRLLLRGQDVTFVSDRRGTLVVPADRTHTARMRNVLRSYEIDPEFRSSTDDGGRGLYVAAETFNR